MRLRMSGAALVALLYGCGDPATGSFVGLSQRHAIVGGAIDTGHPTVGMVASNGGCSGTLIGAHTVLTAGHCLGSTASFTLGASTYGSTAVIPHPSYCGGLCNDIGIITLGQDVGISPSPLHVDVPFAGQPMVAVGFGYTSAGAGDYGTKRAGSDVIDTVNATDFLFGASISSCSGDSGGPSFVMVDSEERVAGVHSVATVSCSQANDTRVDVYASWIASVAGGDVVLPATCAMVTCDNPPGPCHEAVGACSAGRCSYAPLAAGVECDDGDPCTAADSCDGDGVCEPGVDICNDGGPTSDGGPTDADGGAGPAEDDASGEPGLADGDSSPEDGTTAATGCSTSSSVYVPLLVAVALFQRRRLSLVVGR